MDLWKSRSNSGKQTALSVACVAVGLVLVIGFRNFEGVGSNAGAGFLLGLLVLFIGVPGLLMRGKQTVLVNPGTRQITIEDSNRFRTKKRTIPFSDIVSVSIGYLGKKSNNVTWYYLVLKLRSGEDYPLFAPGRFFEGASDRSIVMSWKQRLETYLGHERHTLSHTGKT
ncbi:MAG: hypothetical protein M0Z59_06160 [Nitrospiraceae bacterium]|nr:hypothetical protein [Nitrospiraceae bacterium]